MGMNPKCVWIYKLILLFTWNLYTVKDWPCLRRISLCPCFLGRGVSLECSACYVYLCLLGGLGLLQIPSANNGGALGLMVSAPPLVGLEIKVNDTSSQPSLRDWTPLKTLDTKPGWGSLAVTTHCLSSPIIAGRNKSSPHKSTGGGHLKIRVCCFLDTAHCASCPGWY